MQVDYWDNHKWWEDSNSISCWKKFKLSAFSGGGDAKTLVYLSHTHTICHAHAISHAHTLEVRDSGDTEPHIG